MNVLFWSGGDDSTLLLAILKERGVTFDIVQLGRETWTKAQLRRADELIIKWNLKVFTYPPFGSHIIGRGSDLALARWYAVGATAVPIVTDIVDGDKCLADASREVGYAASPFAWTDVYVGSRKGDEHWSLEAVIPSSMWTVNGVTFHAPLYEFTDADVDSELAIRSIDKAEVDTGDFATCSACVQEGTGQVYCPKDDRLIDRVIWDKEAGLQQFREAVASA